MERNNSSHPGSCWNSLELWQPIGDFIVVTFLCNKNMQRCVRLRGAIKCAHGDSNPILGGWIKEHGASTDGAKPAPNFCRRVIPADVLGTGNLHGIPRYISSHGVMPGELPALYAVTSVWRFQFTRDSELHRPTDARSTLHSISPFQRTIPPETVQPKKLMVPS